MENKKLKLPNETGIAVVMLLVLLVGFIATPNFLTVSNILILLLNGSVICFLCLGQTFVLLTGGIDLSTGSIVAMTCVLAAVFMEYLQLAWYIAVILVLAIGAFTGFVNGFIISKTKVPPFIVTFAMQGVAASIPQIITKANSIRVTDTAYSFIGQGRRSRKNFFNTFSCYSFNNCCYNIFIFSKKNCKRCTYICCWRKC